MVHKIKLPINQPPDDEGAVLVRHNFRFIQKVAMEFFIQQNFLLTGKLTI